MNDQQFFAIALTTLPVVITVVIGILMNNGRLSDLNGRIGDLNLRFTETNARINESNASINELRADMNHGFEAVDERFKEMKDLWRSELHRVEGILDARLKHFEER
jgi:hypothetical protein